MRNSYTNKRARALGYASGLEVDAAKQLEESGVYHEYESESCKFTYFTSVPKGGVIDKGSLEYILPKGCKVVQWHTYTCDFLVRKKDGTFLFIETKGYFKPKDRVKHQALKKMYPDIDLRIIFQSNGKVSHKTSYAQWAEKHNIPYHVLSRGDLKIGKIIPEEWLAE